MEFGSVALITCGASGILPLVAGVVCFCMSARTCGSKSTMVWMRTDTRGTTVVQIGRDRNSEPILRWCSVVDYIYDLEQNVMDNFDEWPSEAMKLLKTFCAKSLSL